MKVTLLQQTEHPLAMIANCASVCYDSEVSDARKLCEKLYRSGHLSVFEHVYYTFRLDDVSRVLTHQLVRHRHCAFTQRSQRYCSEDGARFVVPDKVSPTLGSVVMLDTVQIAQNAYNELRMNGVSAEDARYLLPGGIASSIVFSCNLRELMHIANERLCLRAQNEIREMMVAIREIVDEDVRWLLVPKCQVPTYRCLEKCPGREKE